MEKFAVFKVTPEAVVLVKLCLTYQGARNACLDATRHYKEGFRIYVIEDGRCTERIDRKKRRFSTNYLEW